MPRIQFRLAKRNKSQLSRLDSLKTLIFCNAEICDVFKMHVLCVFQETRSLCSESKAIVTIEEQQRLPAVGNWELRRQHVLLWGKF